LAFAGSASNQFFGILVDGSGNASTSAGSPHSVNGDNLFLAASGKMLFVDGHFFSNDPGDNITSFRSDANGTLTNLGNVTADGAAFIAADASGKFVYASADTNNHNQGFTSPAIYGFAVDQASGKLTALPGSPWALTNGEAAGDIGVSPNGSHVCIMLVLARSNEGVQCYPRHSDGTIDPSSFVTPVISSTTIPSFTFSSDGTHVISTDGENNMVHSSAIATSPATASVSSGGSFADGVALDASGHWLAVVNFDSATVSIVAVTADGTLSAPGAPVAVGAEASLAAFSQNGNDLFVTAIDGTRVYSFDPKTGALKPLNSGNPLPGTGPVVGM
jgi:6-phosphogluconolactonase (cycloisomerase 2 family)